MKKLWSIPIAAIYLYALSILTQGGYDSYFNIPSAFISASIVNNTLFAYLLFKAVEVVIIKIGWWWILIVPILIILGFLSHIYLNDHRAIFIWAGTITAIFLLSIAISLGEHLAKERTDFLVPSPECPPIGSDSAYIIPDIYEGKAIFVPITQEATSARLGTGFMIKEISELPCKLVSKNVGKITK